MSQLKKIAAQFLGTGRSEEGGKGLYADLDELMKMRRYAVYRRDNRRRKTYSEQSGDIKSVFKGRGVEMEEIREYQFGDDVRDIDWRVTARKETPYTRIYAEERDHEVYAWLDLSPLMVFGSKDELKSVTAAKLAALLGWTALSNKDRFGCIIFDGRQSWLFKPKRDRAYLAAILKKTAEISRETLQNDENSDEARLKSLKLLQANVKNRAEVFVISSFNGWGDEYDNETAILAGKTQMMLIDVVDPLERKAPAAGQYMAEYRGEKLVFDSGNAEFRRRYEDYFADRAAAREKMCRRWGCGIIRFAPETGFGRGLKILQRKS